MTFNSDSKKTILIASDDKTTTECILNVIDEDQFRTICLTKASEVLLNILDVDLDLLIIDTELSGIPGIEVMPIIKKLRPNVPIIIVSSDNSFEIGQQIAKLGIWSNLNKPIETDKLECFLSYVQMQSSTV